MTRIVRRVAKRKTKEAADPVDTSPDGSSEEVRVRQGPSREATERALMDAALELLNERGALSGVNLREIADKADVHRGLVYHYFGSRSDLLRAAARRHISSRRTELIAHEELEFAQRMTRMLETAFQYPDAARLSMLLVLDHDKSVRTMPFQKQAVKRLQQDIDKGQVVVEDAQAMYTMFASIVYGFLLLRQHFARELGCKVDDLEERLVRLCEVVFELLERSDGVTEAPDATVTPAAKPRKRAAATPAAPARKRR